MEILVDAMGGETRTAPAHDPLGRPIEARYGLVRDGPTAIVEVAAASGLGLVDEAERDPERASSAGTGELIAAAIGAGARRILVAAGGSATTDGGRGAIDALRGRRGPAATRSSRCSATPPSPSSGRPRCSARRRAPRPSRSSGSARTLGRGGGRAAARPAGPGDDRRRRRTLGRPLGGVRRAPGSGGGVRARGRRLRPATRAGGRGDHRRGPPRRSEPRGKADRRDRAALPRSGGAVPRDRGRDRVSIRRMRPRLDSRPSRRRRAWSRSSGAAERIAGAASA